MAEGPFINSTVKGNWDEAIAEFNKAIEINPKFAFAYWTRGIAWEKKGDYDRAIADCTKALEIDARYADAYGLSGMIFWVLLNMKKACSDLKRLCELGDCSDFTFLKSVGQCDTDINQAISLDPNYAEAYNNRGLANNNLGKKVRACDDWKKTCGLGQCKGLNWTMKKGICR